MIRRNNMRGLRVFLIVWLGQAVSLVGSGLTTFGLGFWVYEKTGRATPFAITALCSVLPMLFLSPLAGQIVDRYDRRRVMLVSDLGSGMVTLAAALLFFIGDLQTWHVYFLAACSAGFGSFQRPAYLAAASQLLEKRHLGRAGGLMQVGLAAADVAAPVLAGGLVGAVGVGGVMLVDALTFLLAVMTLAFVRFPAARSHEVTVHGGLMVETREALKYIFGSRLLVGLLFFLAVTKFATGIIGALLVPMLLSITPVQGAGLVITIAGAGMVAGSLVLSVWGGPGDRLKGLLLFELGKGAGIFVMGLYPYAWVAALGATIAHFCLPMVSGLNQVLWQETVPHVMQGRVFALREMVSHSLLPAAYLIAGPLADRVTIPLAGDMASGIGWVFILMGAIIFLAALGGLGMLTTLKYYIWEK